MSITLGQSPFLANSEVFIFDHGQLFVFDEIESLLHFPIRRIFVITGVVENGVRGNHAHRKCWQALLATSGSVVVSWENAFAKGRLCLDSPNKILIVPPLNWIELREFSSLSSSVTVVASDVYEEIDYIRDKGDFRNINETLLNSTDS